MGPLCPCPNSKKPLKKVRFIISPKPAPFRRYLLFLRAGACALKEKHICAQ
ncbi:unnamed protein product [Staurois parvus]|uniref:Uncharacterized protein n=1 Tax=Staurois parvus TaxID=386267 RepID=A0ABN9EJV4_9NEOB|nr:unnamed protein product [Staurois parvus]